MPADVLAKLRPLKWKGFEVPSSRLGFRLRHDLVQHKYPSKDGAMVENTGRAPLEFTAVIPFRNGLERAPFERWPDGNLYPGAFREFLRLASETTTGDLDHPEFGKIRCKLDAIEGEWDPKEERAGIDLRATWIETVEEHDSFKDALSGASPAAALDTAAAQADAAIDAAIARLKASNAETEAATREELEAFKEGRMSPYTFGDFARQLKAPTDSSTMTVQNAVGKVDAITFRAQELRGSVDRAKSPAVFYPLQDAADRLESAAIDMREDISSRGNKAVKLYTTPSEMTLDDIARAVGASFEDVLRMNGALALAPSVPQHTVVRYPG